MHRHSCANNATVVAKEDVDIEIARILLTVCYF